MKLGNLNIFDFDYFNVSYCGMITNLHYPQIDSHNLYIYEKEDFSGEFVLFPLSSEVSSFSKNILNIDSYQLMGYALSPIDFDFSLI